MILPSARLLALLFLALPLALPLRSAGPAPEDGATKWLERLASGSATERDRAQRWLGANLALEDYPELAAGARRADAETSRRLIDVLGADGAHLGLVALLLTDREPLLETIGEGAFDELVARWCPGATGTPALASEITDRLAREATFDLVVEPASEALERGIDRLARFGGLGIPLVVDPASASTPFEHRGFSGTALEILKRIVKERRLAITGIGRWEGEQPGPGAWILVSARGGSRSQSGAERLRRWVVGVERGGTDAARCARALGACGWPAALTWLDRRWSERGDEAALEGVLIAGARGRVSRSLRRHGNRLELLAAADRALASGSTEERRRAERIARALAGAGAMSLGGEDRGGEILEGWERLSPRSRWLRLVVAEGQRSSRSDLRDSLLEVIEREPGLPPALRFQALRALAAPPRRPLRSVVPAEIPRLLQWARSTGHSAELIVLFGALRVTPPVAPSSDPPSPLLLAGWWLQLGDAEAFVELLSRRGVLPEPLRDIRAPAEDSWSEHFRRWAHERGPTRLRELVGAALERTRGIDRRRLRALALFGGCLDVGEQRALHESLAEKHPLGPLQLQQLGALCGGPERRAAQEELLLLLGEPPEEPERREALARGLDRAVAALTAARRDRAASELRTKVWALAWKDEHPLKQRLAPPGWPARVAPIVVELASLERELPGSLGP